MRDKYAKSEKEPNKAPDERVNTVRCLEDDFNIERGSIVMYCPTEGMNAKIAEVKIKFNETVAPFNELEKNDDTQLSGGHLAAQLKRYERLWRVHFFIDRKVKKDLEEKKLLELLLLAIDKLVLNNLGDGEVSLAVVETLIGQMTANPKSLWHGYAVDEEMLKSSAAKIKGKSYYPFDSPSIKSCLKKKDVKENVTPGKEST
ncbi:MAG TPA: hypothetical protein ACFYD9_10240 [Candidatus Wunengus sp. YC64]|uniref:hypothetical protein n=1 Tax=Candidatus Wunengus sp. YC64 TaxID=3367700 RepID=UPI004024AE2F